MERAYMESLSDILSGKSSEPAQASEPAPVAAEPAAVQPEPQPSTGVQQPAPADSQAPGQPRDDAGRFATKPKDEGQAKPPVPPTGQQDPQHVPVSALQEERRKRQEYERQLADLQRHVQTLTATPPKPAEPPKVPQLFEDPEAWQQHVNQQIEERERQFEERLANERLNMSEMMARQAHGSEVVEKAMSSFQDIIRQHPEAYQHVMSQPHPWDAMVKLVQRAEALSQIGDPITFRQKTEEELRQKIRAELEAEMAAKAPQAPQAPPAPVAPPPSLPTPLGSVPSVAPRATGPAWTGPTPLSDVFRTNRR